MKNRWLFPWLAALAASFWGGCASHPTHSASTSAATNSFATELRALQNRFAPDYHLAVYDVNFEPRGGQIVLSGEVSSDEARDETVRAAERTGAKVVDKITVLPDASLGETNYAITILSVANGREEPDHKAELGTQTLMGDTVRVLKRNGRWYLVQSRDEYLSWMEAGSLKFCTRAQADAWNRDSLVIFTELDGQVREAADANATIVCDIVLGGRVKSLGNSGDWMKVALPDGRNGFVPGKFVTDYAAWKKARQASPETIERVGKQFIGRPYLWGANTPRGMDCSGFTKLTYFLNGIDLRRNASQQARQGVPVTIDDNLSQLKKGDLLFFGFEGRDGRRGRISHVGIYLGDKMFIQSSQRVRISSLDAESALADRSHGMRNLVAARRVLPEK